MKKKRLAKQLGLAINDFVVDRIAMGNCLEAGACDGWHDDDAFASGVFSSSAVRIPFVDCGRRFETR